MKTVIFWSFLCFIKAVFAGCLCNKSDFASGIQVAINASQVNFDASIALVTCQINLTDPFTTNLTGNFAGNNTANLTQNHTAQPVLGLQVTRFSGETVFAFDNYTDGYGSVNLTSANLSALSFNFTYGECQAGFKIPHLTGKTICPLENLNVTNEGNYSLPDANCIIIPDPVFPPAQEPNITNVTMLSYSSINVQWRDVHNESWNGIVRNFTLYVRQGNETYTITLGPDVFEYNVTGLIELKSYTVQLACTNEHGEGVLSPGVSITMDQMPIMEPPTNVALNITNISITITWSEPEALPQIFFGYKVHIAMVPQGPKHNIKRRNRRATSCQSTVEDDREVTLGNVTSLTLNDLYGHAVYEVWVQAYNKYPGNKSDVHTFTTPEKLPLKSAECFHCAKVEEQGILLAWKHAPYPLMQGVRTQYTVYYWDASGVVQNCTRDPRKEECRLVQLDFMTEYDIYLSAWNSRGEGKATETITCKTLEATPLDAPGDFTATSFESPYTSALSWKHINATRWRGEQLGYVIWYQKTFWGSTELLNPPTVEMLVNFTDSFLLTGLDVFATYRIRVAGTTNAGPGKKTAWVTFQTCRLPSPTIQLDYLVFPPYVTSSQPGGPPGGLLIDLVESSLLSCSLGCKAFTQDVHFNYTEVSSSFASFQNYTPSTHSVVAPQLPPKKFSEDGKYLEIGESSGIWTAYCVGIVLLRWTPSDEEKVETMESEVIDSLMESIPALVFFALINAIFGGIFWFFEPTHTNHYKGCCCFSLFGMVEAMFFALVTSTTVGYGDKVPRTGLGRVYTMLWMLLGMALTSVVVSYVSSSLSSVTLTSINQQFPTEKVIAVKGTYEYQYGDFNIDSFVKDVEFSSYTEMVNSILDGTYKYALMDQYVAGLYTTRFADKIEIYRTYSRKSMFGVTLMHEHQILTKCAKEFVKLHPDMYDNAISRMKAGLDRVKAQREEESTSFIDVNGPLLQFVLIVLFGMLGAFFLFGCIYEVIRWKRMQKQANRTVTTLDRRLHYQKEMREFIQEYTREYAGLLRRFQKKTDDILLKQGEAIVQMRVEASKMYNVNFKYVKITDLGVGLDEIMKYKEEKANLPKVPFHKSIQEWLRLKGAAIKIRVESVANYISKTFL